MFFPVICRDGWIKYKTSCYIFKKEMKNWYEASQSCEEEGGNLASILDKEENDFIHGKIFSFFI